MAETIPDDLEVSVVQYEALRRHRGFAKASDLLRVILMYTTLLSLRNTALWAASLGVCTISRQALERRILASTAWLRHLLARQLTALVIVPQGLAGIIQRLILMDASVVARRGSPGTEWRLHLSWQPFQQQPAGVMLSDAHEGEGLDKFPWQAGDLVIADRGHGFWRNLAVVLQARVYCLIRLTWSNLPLQRLTGAPFDLCAWLRGWIGGQTCAELTVVAQDDPQRQPLRLIAAPLPPDKAQEAQERVRRQAQEAKHPPHPNTLLAAGFCILITNLPPAYPPALILSLYRLRWQVEWCFRRWKSLCQLDQLPAYPAAIAEPVLVAKLLLILLVQHRLNWLPWEQWWAAEETAPVVSSLVQLTYAYVCHLIRPVQGLTPFINDPARFLRYLRSSRRKRPLQLTDAARRFGHLLTTQPSLNLVT